MSKQPKAFVMMATYNGEKYLREQIDSILAQEGVEVTLNIRDDQSTDTTFSICLEYQHKDNRVCVMRNNTNLGCIMNFMQMIYETNPDEYDLFAFSDQDDVWLPDKLCIAASAISKIEQTSKKNSIAGIGLPILYCSDLQNVDENLKNPKLELASMGIRNIDLRGILVRNYFSGCTMVMNVALVKLLQRHPVHELPRYHDLFCAQVAEFCGELVVDYNHAQILRRISDINLSGAIMAGDDLKKASFGHLMHAPKRTASALAKILYDNFSPYMSNEDKKLVYSLAYYYKSPSKRIHWVLNGVYSYPTKRELLLARVKFLLGRF